MSKRHRWHLGWIAGAAIIAIILYHLSQSPQWRNFDWAGLWSLLIHLKARLLALALIGTCSTYVVRAYRWRSFVDPIKRCSFRVLFAGQVLGFSSIYLVGRAGELVRPGYVAKKEHLPFMSQMAVLVLERIYDSFALVVLVALALYFEPIHAAPGRSALFVHKLHAAALVILIGCATLASLLTVFKIYSEVLLGRLDHILNFGPRILRAHLMRVLVSFSSGLKVIHNPWEFSETVAATILLWIINVTVIWLDLLSLGGQPASLSWWAASLIAFLAAMGLLVQLPGVGGGFQIAVLLALEDIFHVSAEAAAGAAILTYITVMAPCIAVGITLAVHEGVTFGKLRVMAEMEKEGIELEPHPASLSETPSSGRAS